MASLLVTGLAGCHFLRSAMSESLEATSIGSSNVELAMDFDNVLFAPESTDNITVVFWRGVGSTPTRAAVLRMFWSPQAGRTPVDPTATNATLTLIDFPTPTQAVVYRGAGFVYPSSGPGDDTFAASVWDITLKVASHSSQAVVAQQGPWRVTGSFRAQRQDEQVVRQIDQLRKQLSEALGEPSLVLEPGNANDHGSVVRLVQSLDQVGPVDVR